MRLSAAATILFAFSLCLPARAEQSAEDILKDAGLTGGLVVQIGCGDGKAITALGADESFLVQGLDTDPANVAAARAHVRSLGLAGRVTVTEFDGHRLPYTDNLVNVIVADDLGDVSMTEVKRVLCPGGAAYVRSGDKFKKTVKPRPDEIDEWTHYLHGPDNNAVAEDSVVGPPQHFQWISEPRFSRSHDHLASVSTVVTSAGRLFYIVDAGSTAFAGATPKWRLVARDAFNGVKLWERDIPTWAYHLRDFRSGPAEIPRRLVAVGNRVYVTLGYGQPVTALDAASGETVLTYVGTEGAEEILYFDDMLLLVIGEPDNKWRVEEAKQIVSQEDYSPPFENYQPPSRNKRVMALDAASGELVWKSSKPYTQELMPSTLAADAGRVYFQNADAVVCLDASTGGLEWKTPRPIQRRRLAWSTPTLVVYDGVVFSADRRAADKEGDILWMPSGGYHQYIQDEDVDGQLIAYSAETGEQLWSCQAYESFNAPVDVIISDGLVWTGRYAWGNDPGVTEARDPKTGEVLRRRPSDDEFLPRIGHARCHRAKATTEYLILGRRGVEFVDLETGRMVANRWVRGICQYGVMPANGLLYIPPHSCACTVNDMLKSGFISLAPSSKEEPITDLAAEAVLHKGPAYGLAPAAGGAADDDWPTYRHDGTRSGATSAAVSDSLKTAWQANLGGKLTGPVVADGRLVVAQVDTHYVHALDAATGSPIWTYAAGGRIDSPPSIHRQQVVFGSADGHVYCLRLDDGELVWKFRAGPRDRQIVANGQLESAWPVSGSVLTADGAVYFAAGRTSHLDGGMSLYKLDAATGEELGSLNLSVEKEQRDGGIPGTGFLPDVLSTDGESIFMRSARFDLGFVRQKEDVAHVWSSVGFLDHNWWHRTYWQVGTAMSSGWGGWTRTAQQVPVGRLLVTDGSRVFGFGRTQHNTPGAHVGVDGAGAWGPVGEGNSRWTSYHLFGQTVDTQADKQSRRESKKPAANKPDWSHKINVLGQAMILADQTIFIGGPADDVDEIIKTPSGTDRLADALLSTRGGRLLAVSATDGQPLAEYQLESPPVFDGMAAAGGSLYVSTKDGKVVCMGPAR